MLHHAAAAELDGKQVLDFYWTDPIDAIKRFVAKRQYKNKLYTTFQPGTSMFHPNDRAFDKANSVMVFQGSYLVDSGCSPLLALFYADASFSWTEHVPSSHIQYVCFVCYYMNYANYGIYIPYTYYWHAVCLLNLHEDERTKPRNWIPVGWIPVYDESRDKRPNKGFDTSPQISIVPSVLDRIS